MLIRPLDSATDRAQVEAFFLASADYITLERGQASGPEVSHEFFTDAPPGIDPATSHRIGLFNPDLIGIAEISFGYPTAQDAYLGLMIIAPSARGAGAGQTLLRHLESTARHRGAQTLCLGVLAANPRGHAFWTREGFTMALENQPVTLGSKTQPAHRLMKPL